MIQYNVTIKLDAEVESKWLDYMKKKHIQDVLDTGLVVHYRLSKLIQNGEDGPSYTIQYILPSMRHMHMYQSKHASRLQEEHTEKFKGQFVAFRTMMEVVSELESN